MRLCLVSYLIRLYPAFELLGAESFADPAKLRSFLVVSEVCLNDVVLAEMVDL